MPEANFDKPIPHGTNTGYAYHKCRCDDCKTAASEYHKAHYQRNRERKREASARRYAANRERLAAEQRARYAADPDRHRADARARYAADPDRATKRARELQAQGVPIPHGTLRGYGSRQCRCGACKAAKAASARAYREQNREAVRGGKAAYYQANRDRCDAANRDWIASNRERDREVRAARRAADPEYPAKQSARGKQWYAANRDHVLTRTAEYARAHPEERRAIGRRWRAANPERAAEASRSWCQRNPEKGVATSARRRARKRGNKSFVVSIRDWRRLCARYDDRCAYCGAAGRLSQDHVVPVVRGGSNGIGNLLPACRSCNSRKRHRTIMEWRMAELAAGRDWRPLWRSV